MKKPKIILVSGMARAGKDTFVDLLLLKNKRFIRYAFADQLKVALEQLIRNNFGWDIFNLSDKQKKIIRPIMISFGCAMREVDVDYWVKKVDFKINNNYEDIIPVISDCRFISEYNYYCNKYGADNVVLVEIIREGAPPPPEEELKNQPLLRPHVDYKVEWPTYAPDEKEKCKQYVDSFYNFIYS